MALWMKKEDGTLVDVSGGGGGGDAGPHDHDYLPLSGGTLTGDLQVDGSVSMGDGKAVYFGGNWEGCRIFNTVTANREYMVLGNGTVGAQINLYGLNDDISKGNILFYAGEAEGGGARTVGRWDGPTGSFIAYRDAEVRGNLTVNGKVNGQSVFGITEGIDTADVLERAETATMPAPDEEGVATTDADLDSITVNEVVTALLAKVKEQSEQIAILSADIQELKGN